MKRQRFHNLLFWGTLSAAILCALSIAAHSQPSPEDRAQELIDRFDSRVGEVQTLVDATRNPAANALLQQAIALRNQAESQFRSNRFEQALLGRRRRCDRARRARARDPDSVGAFHRRD